MLPKLQLILRVSPFLQQELANQRRRKKRMTTRSATQKRNLPMNHLNVMRTTAWVTEVIRRSVQSGTTLAVAARPPMTQLLPHRFLNGKLAVVTPI
jgi:hypothetical protein